MSKAFNNFLALMKKSNKIGDDCYSVSTAIRKTLVVPLGFKIYDSDTGMTFVGDGTTYGGKAQDTKEEVRTITAVAASVFTVNDIFKVIASSSGGVYTSTSHGFTDGTVIVPMAADATYGLEQDVEYTVANATTHTFTLVGNTPDDQTANVTVRKYSLSNNNSFTWPQAAYLRTGDAVTAATGGGTLPSGLSATTYYVVKEDTTANGGPEKNVSTKIRFSDTRAHALAGTDIITIRSAGAGSPTFVTAEVYLTNLDKVVVVNNAVAVAAFLPSGTTAAYKRYEITGISSANCTVKSIAGTVGGQAAGTGLVLKASSLDYINVVSDGTNWILFAKQITP